MSTSEKVLHHDKFLLTDAIGNEVVSHGLQKLAELKPFHKLNLAFLHLEHRFKRHLSEINIAYLIVVKLLSMKIIDVLKFSLTDINQIIRIKLNRKLLEAFTQSRFDKITACGNVTCGRNIKTAGIRILVFGTLLSENKNLTVMLRPKPKMRGSVADTFSWASLRETISPVGLPNSSTISNNSKYTPLNFYQIK